MAKKSKIVRNIQRMDLCSKYEQKRRLYKTVIKFNTWYDIDVLPEGIKELSMGSVLRMADFSTNVGEKIMSSILIKAKKQVANILNIEMNKDSFDIPCPLLFSLNGKNYCLLPLKESVVASLSLLPRNSSKVRIRNRCKITGRPRGYYRYFGISRNLLRSMALEGELPGVKKHSW